MCIRDSTYASPNDMYYAIATKSLSASTSVERMLTHKTSTMGNDDLVKMFNRQETKRRNPLNKTGVKVAGIDSILVSLAACCNPVPGDAIVGYISKGQGVKVHRADCPNIANETRLIDVEWEDVIDNKEYEAKLVVHSTDRNYLLSDIVTVVSQCKAGLLHVDSKVDDDKAVSYTHLFHDWNYLGIL